MLKRSTAAIGISVLLVLTGCSSSETPVPKGPSYDTAVAKAQKNARHVFDAVRPRAAKMKKNPPTHAAVVHHCSKGRWSSSGKVSVEVEYRLTGVTGAQITKYFADFERTFKQEGWKKDRASSKLKGVVMDKNGYSVLVETTGTRDYILLASVTPCMEPKDARRPSELPSPV